MKERIDIVTFNKGLFPSREKAKTSIMAGIVFVDNQRIDKPGTLIDVDSNIFVKENICPYVGRGGLKLEEALKKFPIDIKDKVCMDMGASTGGFTDCMLQNGAAKVYAIDVGYGQLDYKLRQDSRVVNIEKTNIRYMDPKIITDKIAFICIDVSFISLNLIFPVAAKILSSKGKLVALVKPQFEAGRDQVSKGIVRDKKIHEEVIEKIKKYAKACDLKHIDTVPSPITGAKGNIEFLMLFEKK